MSMFYCWYIYVFIVLVKLFYALPVLFSRFTLALLLYVCFFIWFWMSATQKL